MRSLPRSLALAAALALALPLAACGGDDAGSDGGSATTTLKVFAAASLTDTFTTLAKDFEAAHDGVDVVPTFGGSSDLEAQIEAGNPADVFASADTATMDELVAAGLAAGTPVDFAGNTLEIVVPPGNPAGITDLQDLATPGLALVVCAPEVPCGAAAAQVASNAGVTLAPVSEEQKVTDVLTKVSSGEADAGLVYVTDVQGAGDDVEGITFPESDSVVNSYPIATVDGAEQAGLAQEFIDLVLSEQGQSVLQQAGFRAAP